MSAGPENPTAYLVANARKEEALAAFDDLRRWLESRGRLAASQPSTDHLDPNDVRQTGPNRLVALGGDGTLLSVGRALAPTGIPIVGVNMGKLGYLAAYSVDDFRDNLDAALSDDRLISSRMMLSITVTPPGHAETTLLAVNDCVIHTGPPYRVVVMNLSADDQPLTSIAADGLIVSTPTGSTAHNLSAGGPIMQPEVRGIVVAPICPHSFAHRPIVVDATTTLTIRLEETGVGTTAMIDGQESVPLHDGSLITIRRAEEPFRLVQHPYRSAWQALVQKLKWGDGPVRGAAAYDFSP